MTNCALCQKKMILKFLMSAYNLKATDIAKKINVSDSLVRKHLEGLRYCQMVDVYLIELVFDIDIKELNEWL